MSIESMNLAEVEARLAAIPAEIETRAGAELKELRQEVADLLERKAELEAIARRAEQAKALENGAKPDKIKEERKEMKPMEEKKIITRDMPEYREAFMAVMAGRATAEQRGIFADNAAYGDGIALPVALDEQVWNQIATAHPILADVTRLLTGIAIKVTKMTPAAVVGKKDSAASTEMSYTSVEVTLVGVDYHTYITMSYAEAQMSQGALETFLVNDLAVNIGEALAKDVFARILSDAGSGQKVTATADMFADIKAALALAKTAGVPVIYAPSASYYEIVGAIKSGSPFNIGATLGCQVKLDNAATKVTVVDPTAFVLNVIMDMTMDKGKDLEKAKHVISGYCRAEGCLRKTTAAAYIA